MNDDNNLEDNNSSDNNDIDSSNNDITTNNGNTQKNDKQKSPISQRFRGFLPVIIDVESAGLTARTDALLEIAAVLVHMDDDGKLYRGESHFAHVVPFKGANLDPKALEFNKIDPFHPFRMAIEEDEALRQVFKPIRDEVKKTGCQRAVLVGHNAWFDLAFVNAAVKRTGIKRNPFHPFTSFDTASLGALVYGQTVLARALGVANIDFDREKAHSAKYDAEVTADLFCQMVNESQDMYTRVTTG